MKKIICAIVTILYCINAHSQNLNDADTTAAVGKIKIGGYIQTQYQHAQSPGIKSYNGGDFNVDVDDRFMIRRGRMRFDYVLSKKNWTTTAFVFQFDCSERGVFVRDFWGRIYENKLKLFSFTTGLFARPFGNEINMGSGDRESAERGRMSQILMRTERDLGAMLTIEPTQSKNQLIKKLKVDVGVFNGPGLIAMSDYDTHKDIIARASVKPIKINFVSITGGVSYYTGGIGTTQSKVFEMRDGSFTQTTSSFAQREYRGADIQLKFHNKGKTELRYESISGTQTGTQFSNETPGSIITNSTPIGLYQRNFSGSYAYLLHWVNKKTQLVVKYDSYDPNSKIKGENIGPELGAANIKFETIGFGINYHINQNVKALLYYEVVKNETTALEDDRDDLRDNTLTCRLQYRF